MVCLKCNKNLVDCECPDIDHRLALLKDSPYCGDWVREAIGQREQAKKDRWQQEKNNHNKRLN